VTGNRIIPLLFYSMAAALLLHEAAAAGDGAWRIYAEEANRDVHFYDAAEVQADADLRLVRTRIRYRTSVMGASSYQSLLEIDCAARTERTLQRTFFSDRDWDVPAMSPDRTAKPKRPIKAGSPAAQLFEILCEP